jgi:hypothetical protein
MGLNFVNLLLTKEVWLAPGLGLAVPDIDPRLPLMRHGYRNIRYGSGGSRRHDCSVPFNETQGLNRNKFQLNFYFLLLHKLKILFINHCREMPIAAKPCHPAIAGSANTRAAPPICNPWW